jgi:excisionase family DNA binding protein
MSSNNKYYTIEEAIDILGVSEHEIMNMITLGKLPAVKVEKTIKIREEDIEKFLDNLGMTNYASGNNAGGSPEILEETVGEIREGEIKDKYEVENRYRAGDISEEVRVKLEKSYKELLRKKQELEEDINYLQYKYDEFKDRIKRIISEEFKLFLKKIDEENLQEGDGILEDNFDDDMEANRDFNDIGEDEENKENEFNNGNEALLVENNMKDDKNPISEKDNTIDFDRKEINNL